MYLLLHRQEKPRQDCLYVLRNPFSFLFLVVQGSNLFEIPLISISLTQYSFSKLTKAGEKGLTCLESPYFPLFQRITQSLVLTFFIPLYGGVYQDSQKNLNVKIIGNSLFY